MMNDFSIFLQVRYCFSDKEVTAPSPEPSPKAPVRL